MSGSTSARMVISVPAGTASTRPSPRAPPLPQRLRSDASPVCSSPAPLPGPQHTRRGRWQYIFPKGSCTTTLCWAGKRASMEPGPMGVWITCPLNSRTSWPDTRLRTRSTAVLPSTRGVPIDAAAAATAPAAAARARARGGFCGGRAGCRWGCHGPLRDNDARAEDYPVRRARSPQDRSGGCLSGWGPATASA